MTTASSPGALALDYTARDWSRWDTFDLRRYSLVERKSHGLQTTPLTTTAATANYPATYFHMLRQEYLANFYGHERQAFLWLQKEPGSVDDYLFQLRKNGDFPVQAIVNKASYTLNQEYTAYRKSKIADIRHALKSKLAPPLPSDVTVSLDDQAIAAFDQLDFDFKNWPTLQPLIGWLTEILNTHLDGQVMDPLFTVNRANANDYRGPTWRPYGTWQNKLKGTYDQDGFWWQAAEISYLYGHYLHLLGTDLIRRIRNSARAALGALWQIYQNESKAQGDANPANYQFLESQWMLRLGGWVGFTYVLNRSESELRLRGQWGAALSDLIYEDSSPTAIASRTENRAYGQWSQSEAVAQAEVFVSQLHSRFSTSGQNEFLSSYTLYHLDHLAAWLVHCPASQVIYQMVQNIWKRIQWDLIANWHPSSGSFPGPSGRSYDQFAGGHNYHDRFDQYLYYKHVFSQGAKPNSLLRILTSKEEVRANLRITKTNNFLLHPQYREIARSYTRNMYTAAQLSGEGELPDQLLNDLVLNAPIHVNEQRFSVVPGQERYNFITPHYTMGHSGEGYYSLPTSTFMAARISANKAPVVTGPFSQTNNGPINFASYVRLMGETNDTPYARNGSALAPAGDGQARLMRQIVSQYQGFMLVTHLFAPTSNTTTEELNIKPWNSNLMLPLAVDSLTLNNGTVLSKVAGTKLSIPLDQATVTVRHGSTAIVVRLVSADSSDPLNITWQVDPASISTGTGRIVVNHRSTGSGTAVRPYKVVWLFGSGTYSVDTELYALQRLIQNAPVQQDVTITDGVWNENNQPPRNYPANSPAAPINEVGSRRWTVTATIGNLKLGVNRTDVYLPWNNSPVYAQPRSNPLHKGPYYSKNVDRLVNDRAMFDWSAAEDPYRMAPLKENEVFAPHRTSTGTRDVIFPSNWIHST